MHGEKGIDPAVIPISHDGMCSHKIGLCSIAVALAFMASSCVTMYADGRTEYPEFYAKVKRFVTGRSDRAWKEDEVVPFAFYRPASIPVMIAPAPSGAVPDPLIMSGLPPTLDQGEFPAGPAFSAGYLATTMLLRTRHSGFRCSPGYLFRMMNGSEQNAVETTDVLRFLQSSGCANQSVHPYSSPADYERVAEEAVVHDARNYRISGFARVDLRDLDQVRNHLAAGRPIIVSLVLPENLLHLEEGVFDWPEGDLAGRQSMAVVGLDQGQERILVRNSMGEHWGNRGEAWIPFASFQRLVIDACVVF